MSRNTSARLLLIDDDDDSRGMMARALRQQGHQVVEAADGAEALRLDLVGFDVVLTDLQMPSVGGREVLAAVRRCWASMWTARVSASVSSSSASGLAGAAAESESRPSTIGGMLPIFGPRGKPC